MTFQFDRQRPKTQVLTDTFTMHFRASVSKNQNETKTKNSSFNRNLHSATPATHLVSEIRFLCFVYTQTLPCPPWTPHSTWGNNYITATTDNLKQWFFTFQPQVFASLSLELSHGTLNAVICLASLSMKRQIHGKGKQTCLCMGRVHVEMKM